MAADKWVKLVAPLKTGREEVDDLAKTQFECLIASVEDLSNLPALTTPVFRTIREEKKKVLAAESVERHGHEVFLVNTSYGSLEENFKIAFITRVSDLNAEDIGLALSKSLQHVNDLVHFALQVPMSPAKLPLEFLVKPVISLFNNQRHVEMGSRIAKFKAGGGLQPDGSLNFYGVTGCYTLQYEQKKLVSITHFNGDVARVSEGHGLIKAHGLKDNHSEWNASLVLPPGRPIPLRDFFFEAKAGPWKYTIYQGKLRELQAKASALHMQWSSTTQLLASQLSASSSQVIQAANDKRRAEFMTGARAAGAKAMATKQLRTTRQMHSDPADPSSVPEAKAKAKASAKP